MDKKTNNIIKEFIATVANQYADLKKAYVFGSFAKNIEQPYSDIDIALVIDNLDDNDKFDLQVQLLLIASQLDTRIEPHPFSYRDFIFDNPFTAEIKKTGIEIPVG